MALTRDQFASNLDRAMEVVRKNVAKCCLNELPAKNRYLVILNSSNDGNPLSEKETVFSDHDTPQWDTRVPRSAEEVVKKLWRDGKIPEWIDITPYEVDGENLVSELRCCGRFTDDVAHLYHNEEGYPPFHVFGPVLPVGFLGSEQQEKFDLHCYRDRTRNEELKRRGGTQLTMMCVMSVVWVLLSMHCCKLMSLWFEVPLFYIYVFVLPFWASQGENRGWRIGRSFGGVGLAIGLQLGYLTWLHSDYFPRWLLLPNAYR